MQPFMAAYLEAMVLVNPFLYLKEMHDRLMTDLNLLPNEVLSVPVICRTLRKLNLSKRKSSKLPQEQFLYAVQLGEKASFCPVVGLSRPSKIVFWRWDKILKWSKTVFWTPQEITHPTQTFTFTFISSVLWITSRFQRTLSVSKIFYWSSKQCHFHIRSNIMYP